MTGVCGRDGNMVENGSAELDGRWISSTLGGISASFPFSFFFLLLGNNNNKDNDKNDHTTCPNITQIASRIQLQLHQHHRLHLPTQAPPKSLGPIQEFISPIVSSHEQKERTACLFVCLFVCCQKEGMSWTEIDKGDS